MNRVAACAAILIPAALSAQVRLADDLLKNQPRVNFTNYTGEVQRPDRVDDIIGIGRSLARSILSNKPAAVGAKYYARRVIATNRGLFSADILGIGPESRVDHVKNIRRILAGYLSTAFNRPLREALTLATFVTYYNAAVRRNPELLQKYAPAVLDTVDPAKAGISLNYRDWPGRTELLIPLEVSPLTGSNIASGELYDRATEIMRTQPDRGVREREEMLAARQADIQRRRERVDQALEANIRRQEQVEAAQRRIEREEPSPERDRRLADAQAARENIAQERQQLLAERDRIAEENRRLQQQQQELAEDTKAVNYSGVENAKHLFFLRFLRQERNVAYKQLTAIVKETLTVGRVRKDVTGMNTPVWGDDVFSVLPSPDRSRFLLTLFDGETFDILRQSSQGLYPNTHLAVDAGKVYAVLDAGNGKFHLGQFAAEDLKLLHRTDQEVFPDTGIVVSSETLFVLCRDGKTLRIGAFKKEDLSFLTFVD